MKVLLQPIQDALNDLFTAGVVKQVMPPPRPANQSGQLTRSNRQVITGT